MTFNELVRLLGENGFTLIREKGSVRYYGKEGWDRPIRVDYHGSKRGAYGNLSSHSESGRNPEKLGANP
jgi:predicted RNA binding protein YcfA (HicA-like mRNA interferase family)